MKSVPGQSLVLGLVLTLLLAPVGVLGYARHKMGSFEQHRWTEAEFQQLLADQRALRALDVVSGEPGSRDAGELLNPRMVVNGVEGDLPAEMPFSWDPLYKRRVYFGCRGRNQEWPTCVPGQYAPVDLDFMAQLHDYDTWDLGSSSRWMQALSQPRRSHSFPPYVDLTTTHSLARLRLLQGLQRGDVLQALREVRQLARLTWSTQTLDGAMFAQGILGAERRAYEAAVERGLLAPEDWSPLPREQTDLLSRVSVGTISIYAGWGPADAIPRLAQDGGTPLSECMALDLLIPKQLALRGLSEDRWPGEPGLSEHLAQLDAVIQDTPCRLIPGRADWMSGDLDLLDYDNPDWAYWDESHRDWMRAPLLGVAARTPVLRSVLLVWAIEQHQEWYGPYQ